MKNTENTMMVADTLPDDNARSIAPAAAAEVVETAPVTVAELSSKRADIDNGIEVANKLFNRGSAATQEMQDIQLKVAGSIAALGCHLTRLQGICPHGAWGKLFKQKDGFAFSQQTAKKYMGAYEHLRNKALAVSVERADALDTSLKAAAATNMGQLPYLEDLTDAANTQQLFIEAGVVKKPAKMQQKMEEAAKEIHITPEKAQKGMASSLSMLTGMFASRANLVPRSFNLELASQLRAEADRLEKLGTV